MELTVSYESVVADARERKRSKYYDLMEAGRAAGYRCELITVEVGSRGMLSMADLESIQAAIDAPRREMVNLCLTIIRTTILQSFWLQELHDLSCLYFVSSFTWHIIHTLHHYLFIPPSVVSLGGCVTLSSCV